MTTQHKKPAQAQRSRAFFDPSPDRKHPHLPARPTEDEIRDRLIDNDSSPLADIVVSDDNLGNMRTLQRVLFTGMKRWDHSLRGNNIGFYAGSGQGKSFIVRQFVDTIGLPLVEAQATAIDDTYTLLQMMQDACAKFASAGITMVPDEHGNYHCPAMVIFIDEAHGLKSKLMKGGLLNAMEPDDGILVCSPPGSKSEPITVNCKNVCWIIATTERGMLFDAFDNRLQVHVNWAPADEEGIAQIVVQKMHKYALNNEVEFPIPLSVARKVAKYRRVPREAIGFAKKVIQEKDMFEGTWDQAIQNVAESLGINEHGMTKKEVRVLKAIGQRPTAKGNLTTAARCRIEELERYVLPPLMDHGPEGPMMVMTSRGCTITRAGIARLDEMGIEHKGDKVTVEYAEERK